jgi:MFS transporter, SP family, general alpha glucoside:H+ symporter
MMGWGTYFLEQAGFSAENATAVGIGNSAMGFCGTAASWFLMPHFGRRTLYLYGQYVMFGLLTIMGGLGVAGIPPGSGASGVVGALILVRTFVYDIRVGPVCYSLVAELPSTRLRIKTVVLSRNLYNNR